MTRIVSFSMLGNKTVKGVPQGEPLCALSRSECKNDLRLLLDVVFGVLLVRLQICGAIRSAWGWMCFRVPPFRRHSFGAPVRIRSARDRLTAISGLTHRNAVPAFAAPCGHFASLVRSSSTARLPSESFALLRRIWRPVQHLHPQLRSVRVAHPRLMASLARHGAIHVFQSVIAPPITNCESENLTGKKNGYNACQISFKKRKCKP